MPCNMRNAGDANYPADLTRKKYSPKLHSYENHATQCLRVARGEWNCGNGRFGRPRSMRCGGRFVSFWTMEEILQIFQRQIGVQRLVVIRCEMDQLEKAPVNAEKGFPKSAHIDTGGRYGCGGHTRYDVKANKNNVFIS